MDPTDEFYKIKLTLMECQNLPVHNYVIGDI